MIRRLARRAIVVWIVATAKRRWRAIERADARGSQDANETLRHLAKVLNGINA